MAHTFLERISNTVHKWHVMRLVRRSDECFSKELHFFYFFTQQIFPFSFSHFYYAEIIDFNPFEKLVPNIEFQWHVCSWLLSKNFSWVIYGFDQMNGITLPFWWLLIYCRIRPVYPRIREWRAVDSWRAVSVRVSARILATCGSSHGRYQT